MSTNDEKIAALAASLRGVWSYIHTGQRAYQGDPGWIIPCGFCGMVHLRPPPPGCWEPGDEGITAPLSEPPPDTLEKRTTNSQETVNG